MAFQSLYRKYRPQAFAELVGQEATSTALRNALREDRVGHAYLFSGPRGTGKTTTARLLAKALNCAGRTPAGEPDNTCPSCVEITAGSSLDVVELDAASNRGVSEMRTLLERVAYRSAGGARKVYIIDEVHMLTKEASTALLKTLEEPPGHVVFVLATTDPQMVLPTIRSRTQHFEFSLLAADALANHLASVAAAEGVKTDPESLSLIARRAAGSARDALSLLDQALAYGEGRLEAEQVQRLFGGSAFASRAAILEAVGAGDVPALLEALDLLLGSGTDARTLADDLMRHLREVFLVSHGGPRLRLESPEEERSALAAQGASLGAALVVRCLEALGEAAVEIRRAPDPRLVLEVTLVRLGRRDASTLEVLAERLARLERAMEGLRGPGPATAPTGEGPSEAAEPPPAVSGQAGPRAALGALQARDPRRGPAGLPSIPGQSPPATRVPAEAPPPTRAPAEAPPTTNPPAEAPPAPSDPAPPPAPSATTVPTPPRAANSATGPMPPPITTTGPAPVALEDVVLAWPGALDHLKPRLKAMARESRPIRVDGVAVVLGLPPRYSAVHLPTIAAEAATVAQALSAELGRAVRVRVETADITAPAEGPEGAYDETDVILPPGLGPGVGAGLDSPVALVIETFGATIESESVRDQ